MTGGPARPRDALPCLPSLHRLPTKQPLPLLPSFLSHSPAGRAPDGPTVGWGWELWVPPLKMLGASAA